MVRILWSAVGVLAVVPLGMAIQSQPSAPMPGAPSQQPRVPALVGLRSQMKQIRQMQAQELAGDIGPPPAGCRVVINHIEDDELGEGLAEFIFDVFRRAYWGVEVVAGEPLTCATPGILIYFSPAAAAAAEKLGAVLDQRQRTDLVPIAIDAPLNCSLRITIGPQ